MGKKGKKKPTTPSPPTGLLRRRWVWLLCGITVLGWQLCFPPFDLAPLAFVVLVPWVVAVAAGRGKTAILAGWVTGVAVFGVGLYWLTWVTMVGYLPLIAYLSVYWLAAAWFVRRATARRLPLWLVLPIAWTALELGRAYIITGFPWFCLAHSQYKITALIQTADLTGIYGVSFLVAMVNGFVADAVLRILARRDQRAPAPISRRMLLAGFITPAVLAAGFLGYGAFRLKQAERTCTPGPRIAVVQSAVPIRLGGRTMGEKEFFNLLVELTRPLEGQPLDLVIWPETVLPSQFDQHWSLGKPWRQVDPEAYETKDQEWIRGMQAMNADMAALLGRLDAPLLAGAMTVRPPTDGGERPDLFNSAMMFTTDDGTTLDVAGIYDKMHCVPFSESVPFKHSWPWLHRVLRGCVPEVMPQLTPGERVHRFRFGEETTWTTAAPICYEGVFARVCRPMVYTSSGKQLDVLANISNDGWFIWPGSRQRASSELDQHLAMYVFRAIENRVPVVRAVNTGVSGFIDSSGRIGTVVADEAGSTTMVTGTAIEQVLVDNRVSGYSSLRDWPAGLCSVIAAGLGVWLWWRNRREKSAKE